MQVAERGELRQRQCLAGHDEVPHEGRQASRIGARAGHAAAAATRPGCVAKIAAGCEWPRQTTGQAATWNSSATKLACARMSRPPMLRTCPFLTIAIAS